MNTSYSISLPITTMRSTIAILLCVQSVICRQTNRDDYDFNMEKRLHSNLLRAYDVFQPPSKTTTVSVRFILKHFSFDDNEELFMIYSWMFLVWSDDRLKWDPKDYDGITETQLGDYMIWTPELKHHTYIIYDDFDQEFNTMCQTTNVGSVLCVSQVVTQTECATDLLHWPYDTQKCTFKFGIHSKHKDTLIFTFNSSRGINMFGAEYGPGWNIIDFEKSENASSDTQFTMTFVLERQAESHASITIFPATLLSILTISSLFLDIGNTRGGIGILSLLGHFYIQSFISFSIPVSSSTAPSILHLITTSVAITTVSILLTVVLSYLLRKKDSPHHYIVTVSEFVFKSSLRFFIWPRWEARKIEMYSSDTKVAVEIWNDFANIINSACILIVIIVYICLFSILTPKPLPMI